MMTANVISDPTGAVYTVAEQMLAQRGKTFHWARRLLSQPHAKRATRLYGFCRHIDDLADQNPCPISAQVSLAIVRRALLTGQSNDPALRDMLHLMHSCGIDPAIPLELITGVESDLGDVRVADMAELLRYAYRVAGTVGLMMTAALDVTAAEAQPHAIDLGIAMQLTNICRDVREDALQGRRYLPATLVGGLEPAELINPVGAIRAVVVDTIHALLDIADRHYASGEQGLRCLPAGARAGILVAGRVYREIGIVLRKRDYDCWSSRAMVGPVGKAAVTLRALLALNEMGGAQQRQPLHETYGASLHALALHRSAGWPAEANLAD